MKTLEPYIESAKENRGWKGLLGALLSLIGFGFLTHAFISLFAEADLLPLWAEVAISLLGGAIGTAGLLLRGLKGDALTTPIVILISGVITTIFMTLVNNSLGFLAVVIIGLLIALLHNWQTSRPVD